MKYTVEQLKEMPIQILRGINIESQEEEMAVQAELNTRLADMPISNPMTFKDSVTDNLTPEKEAELQAQINERNAKLKSQFTPVGEEVVVEPVQEVVPEPIVEPVPEVVPEPVIEPVPEVVPGPVVEPVPEARFCEFCDSKGGRHKKECQLYVPTRGPGSVNGV